MKPTIRIPYIEKDVVWQNNDVTYIIGPNGTGKTLLMGAMMEWCDSKGYKYAHYDAITALDYAEEFINDSSDKDVILACKMMSEISIDFLDDVKRWSTTRGYRDGQTSEAMKDADLLRYVLSMCGNGYTRMFIMTVLAAKNNSANYYFLDMPETSLHIHLAERIVEYLLINFRHLKIVITTHSPEIMRIAWDYDTQDMTNIIELPEGYLKRLDQQV